MAHELNSNYLANLTNSNEWYNWSITKAKESSNGYYGENSDFYALWRNADRYENYYLRYTKRDASTAYVYMLNLEKSMLGVPSGIRNEERKELNSLKKLLKLWENKRHIEIQKEEDKRIIEEEKQTLSQIEIQNITFNEQTNSGDFDETPITDINLNGGCSEFTGTEISTDPISEKQLKEGYMKFAGIAAIGVIGLLLYTKGGLK